MEKMGWFWKNNSKKDVEELKNNFKEAFEKVKVDFEGVGEWINHLHDKTNTHQTDVSIIKSELTTIKEELEEMKELMSMSVPEVNERVFKTTNQPFSKQSTVLDVETAVATPVQTAKFKGISNLSVTERALVIIIANQELKLSYEDLAALTGKTKSTIRGQVNRIKQKSEGLIEEYVEMNGKKRVYMPENMKQKILKKAKVSVRGKRR